MSLLRVLNAKSVYFIFAPFVPSSVFVGRIFVYSESTLDMVTYYIHDINVNNKSVLWTMMPMILLMEELPNNHLFGCIYPKPLYLIKSWDFNYQSTTGAGFLNHQQWPTIHTIHTIHTASLAQLRPKSARQEAKFWMWIATPLGALWLHSSSKAFRLKASRRRADLGRKRTWVVPCHNENTQGMKSLWSMNLYQWYVHVDFNDDIILFTTLWFVSVWDFWDLHWKLQ